MTSALTCLQFALIDIKSAEDKVWFRGYGPDRYVYYARKGPKKFLGGTFQTENYQDLQRAAKLPGASSILELSDSPGGGSIVSLTDPEGFPVNVMYGQTPAEVGKPPEKLILNFEAEKPCLRTFQRFEPGPAAVHKQ
ncbi:hypothetical protein B0A49_12194 [Cryomyces minteri]|uniref:Glyoxalase domain-containing protein 4 n=1 Tax=Cryomyces minteri TaxID=331657 RepID=A0A4U0WBH1_9PEZI|nr:hypothetical protein B0A49_12194 [Cryomyces minteri]